MNLVDALAQDGYTLTRAESHGITAAWIVVHDGTDVGLVRPRGRGWEARVGADRVLDLNRHPTRVAAAVAVADAHRRAAASRPRRTKAETGRPPHPES